MIYLLIKRLRDSGWLDAHKLDFLCDFNFVSFQTTVAVLISFLIVLAAGPAVIEWLRRQKIGDAANFDQAQLNELMKTKKGTPTMGGLLIIASIAATTLLLADLKNFYVQMAMICLIWLGGVGATDDWLKLTAARRAGSARTGLTSLEKLLLQVGLAVVLSIFTYKHGEHVPEATRFFFPFLRADRRYIGVSLPLFILIGTLVMTWWSNAVNLTDGLDGLAA